MGLESRNFDERLDGGTVGVQDLGPRGREIIDYVGTVGITLVMDGDEAVGVVLPYTTELLAAIIATQDTAGNFGS